MKYRKLIKQLNNYQLFRILMKRRDKTVKIKVKTKALVSVLLSFVMIMGLLFVPQVYAEDQPDQPNTILFRQVQSELEQVDNVVLEIDGNSQTISYPAGLITDNLATLNQYLTGTQKFEKAIVRDNTNGNETPISRIGTYNETTYYSLNDQQDIGIALTKNQEIVLICASQYKITYEYNPDMGTVTGSTELFKGEDLNIAVKANDYYHIKSITWNEKSINFSDDKNTSIKIAGNEINQDVVVKVDFQKDSSYQIIEKGAWIDSNGHYQGCYDTDDFRSAIQQGDICWDNDTEVIDDIQPGESVTFWLYSQSNSGGLDPTIWYLNMLKFNGENVNVPTSYEIGSKATTPMSNGSNVTIELILENHQIEWKEDKGGTRRTIYSVTIDHVKESINIEGNFKSSKKREMIITGLKGIQNVGALSERTEWHASPSGYHYYYNLQNNDGDTVYDAYYYNSDSIWNAYSEAFNVYLYSVKEGYNPYTVDVEVFYDGKQQDLNSVINENIQKGQTQWVTVDNILNGIQNHSINYRHIDSDCRDKIETEGYTHGIVLHENSSYNQQLRLTAHPYEYNLVFNLNEGEAELGNNYTLNNDETYTFNEKYTLENGAVDAYMPTVKPTKEGSVFLGWKLYKDDEPVNDTLYSSNEAFTIDETSISYSEGDVTSDTGHTFTFVAQWENVADSEETAGIYLEIYKEVEGTGEIQLDNGKHYQQVGTTSLIDYGTVDSSTFFIDLSSKNPNSDIYIPNTDKSIRFIQNIVDENDSNTWKENNTFKVYYDFIDYDLTVKKDAVGEYADLTREWNIQVTLKDKDDNPISNTSFGDDVTTDANGQVTLQLCDNDEFIFKNLNINTRYSIDEIEVPKDYTVKYKINNKESTNVSNQSLSTDTTVTVINTMNDIKIPDTNIPTSGMNSTITMLAIGSLGLIGVIALLWYWRKKHV